MALVLLDLYGRASEWTGSKVIGAASRLDAATPCDEWNVRTLMNHMLDTQNYFVSVALGQDASPPSANPPELLGDDPVDAFERARAQVLSAFEKPDVVERTGMSLGIAASDQLLHGWDLAQATGQEASMPDGLAEAAFHLIHGRFTDEQRIGIFKPEVSVGPDATAQERFLGYTGRDPRI